MHRTLKADATRLPAATFEAQQVRFDAFCREFNQERPHEALAQPPPASCYRSSERPYPKRIPAPEYAGYFETRKVDGAGVFKFQGSRLFIGESLSGGMLGLVEIDDTVWSLRFYDQELGQISTRERKPVLKVSCPRSDLSPMSPVALGQAGITRGRFASRTGPVP